MPLVYIQSIGMVGFDSSVQVYSALGERLCGLPHAYHVQGLLLQWFSLSCVTPTSKQACTTASKNSLASISSHNSISLLFRGRISSNYFSALSYLFPLFPTLHQKLEITVGKATEVFHVAKSRWSVCTLLELSVAFDTGDNYYFKDETLSLLCSREDHAPFLLFQLLWHDILGFSSHVFPSLPQSSVL